MTAPSEEGTWKGRWNKKYFIQFKVGEGNNIHMWLDWWHPDAILYTRYGHSIVYDAGSKVETKLSSVLKGKLDQMRWLVFKANSLWWSLEMLISLSGSYLKREPILVQKLGMLFVSRCHKLIGGIQFGFLWLFLGMLSFCGWLYEIAYQQERRCWNGDLKGMLCVCSAYRKLSHLGPDTRSHGSQTRNSGQYLQHHKVGPLGSQHHWK